MDATLPQKSAQDTTHPKRTQWHRILAKLLELLLAPLGVTVQSEVSVMSDPPKLDILLCGAAADAGRQVRKAAFEGLRQMDEGQLSDAVMELAFGLAGRFAVQEGEMGKVKEQEEQEVITSESLMKLGREIRRMVVATMKPEERRMVVAAMKPEERLAGLAPEDRLAGLSPDELTRLMEEIERRRPRSHN